MPRLPIFTLLLGCSVGEPEVETSDPPVEPDDTVATDTQETDERTETGDTGDTDTEPEVLPEHCVSESWEVVSLELPPFTTTSSAHGINRRGQVVGEIAFTSGTVHAALWTPEGVLTDLEPQIQLDAGRSTAFDITDDGTVIGAAHYEWPDRSVSQIGIRWRDGKGELAVELDLGPARVYGMNNAGMVAGDLGTYGFVHTLEDGLIALPTQIGPGYDSLGPLVEVNELGQVAAAGWTEGRRHAFTWTRRGGMRWLEHGDATESEALGVYGEHAVGRVWLDADPVAAIWDDGTMDALPLLDGATQGEARAVNLHGEVVGFDLAEFTAPASTGWIWSNGQRTTLDSLLADASWHLAMPLDINDAGWVVGVGSDAAFEWRAFLARPVCD